MVKEFHHFYLSPSKIFDFAKGQIFQNLAFCLSQNWESKDSDKKLRFSQFFSEGLNQQLGYQLRIKKFAG